MKKIVMVAAVLFGGSVFAVIPDVEVEAAAKQIIELSKERNEAMRKEDPVTKEYILFYKQTPEANEYPYEMNKAMALTLAELRAKKATIERVLAQAKALPVASIIMQEKEGDAERGAARAEVSKKNQRYVASLRATIKRLEADVEFIEAVIAAKNAALVP